MGFNTNAFSEYFIGGLNIDHNFLIPEIVRFFGHFNYLRFMTVVTNFPWPGISYKLLKTLQIEKNSYFSLEIAKTFNFSK